MFPLTIGLAMVLPLTCLVGCPPGHPPHTPQPLSESPVHYVHPPTQEATAVKPWRNAQRVSSEALAKEDMLRRVTPKKQEGPRL
jgi:hypothetical protein